MAKLYFYYSAMNAGKTTTLLQSSYNYQERGMRTVIYTPRQGRPVTEGPQVEIGGNDRYISVSRAEYKRITRHSTGSD